MGLFENMQQEVAKEMILANNPLYFCSNSPEEVEDIISNALQDAHLKNHVNSIVRAVLKTFHGNMTNEDIEPAYLLAPLEMPIGIAWKESFKIQLRAMLEGIKAEF